MEDSEILDLYFARSEQAREIFARYPRLKLEMVLLSLRAAGVDLLWASIF